MRVWARWLLPLALAWTLSLGGAATLAAQPAGVISPQLEGVGIEPRLRAQIPLDAQFKDSSGRRMRLDELMRDRPVILNLVYFECPMLCNLAMDGLVRTLRALSLDAGDEFTVITVSFDPREGPELAAAAKKTALTRYGREGAAQGWHFLTGEQDEIDRLAKATGFRYRYDQERGQFAHAACTIILTKEGEISRYLLGVDYNVRDLRLSLVEASDNKIGSFTDQVLLLCYHYDPTAGKYGLVIQNVLRGAGVLTVAVIGSALA